MQKSQAEKLGGKLMRKTSAENLGGKPMSHTIYDRTKADIEICAPGKIFAPIKSQAENFCAYQKLGGKVLRLLTIWAWQNLQLLTSSKSG